MEGIGWQVNPTITLKNVQQQIKAEGISSQLVHEKQFGVSEQTELHDPDGNQIYFYHV